jgi:hypothetical protein
MLEPITWTPRSPDLTPLDFFLWGYMQSLVYETPVETQHDRVERIAVAAGTIQEISGTFQRVQHNIARRAEHATKPAAAIFSNFYNDNIP